MIAAALCLSSLIMIFCAETQTVTVTVPTVYGKVGDEVVMKIHLPENSGLTTMKVQVSFNPLLLEFVSSTIPDSTGFDMTMDGKTSVGLGMYTISYIGVEAVNTESDIAEITFRILAGATGDIPVSVEIDETLDVNDAAVNVVCDGGTVHIGDEPVTDEPEGTSDPETTEPETTEPETTEDTSETSTEEPAEATETPENTETEQNETVISDIETNTETGENVPEITDSEIAPADTGSETECGHIWIEYDLGNMVYKICTKCGEIESVTVTEKSTARIESPDTSDD